MLLAPHRGKRVQRHSVAHDQGVEKMPQGGQRQIPGGVRSGQLVEEAPGEARRHLPQLDALLLAPGKKAPHGPGIGAAGVGVGDPGREELVGGEDGILPGSLQEGGESLRQGGGAGNQLVHIRYDNILYRAI